MNPDTIAPELCRVSALVSGARALAEEIELPTHRVDALITLLTHAETALIGLVAGGDA